MAIAAEREELLQEENGFTFDMVEKAMEEEVIVVDSIIDEDDGEERVLVRVCWEDDPDGAETGFVGVSKYQTWLGLSEHDQMLVVQDILNDCLYENYLYDSDDYNGPMDAILDCIV